MSKFQIFLFLLTIFDQKMTSSTARDISFYLQPLPADQNTTNTFVDKTVGADVPQIYMKAIKTVTILAFYYSGFLLFWLFTILPPNFPILLLNRSLVVRDD